MSQQSHDPEAIYRLGNALVLSPLDGNAQTGSLSLQIAGHKQIGWDCWSQVVEGKLTGAVPQNLNVLKGKTFVVKVYDWRFSMNKKDAKEGAETEIEAYKIFKRTSGIEATYVAVSYGSYTLSGTQTSEPIKVLLLENLVGDALGDIIKTATPSDRVVIVRNMKAALEALIKARVFPLDMSHWNFIRLKGGNDIRVVDFGIAYLLSDKDPDFQTKQRVLSGRVLGEFEDLIERIGWQGH